MAGPTLTTAIRSQLSAFADDIASPFPDSRRQRFLREMIPGLVIAGHVHLTAIARATGDGTESLHAAEKRLGRHLASEHGDATPIAAELLRRSAALVTDDTRIVADTTDLAKYHAKHLEGLGRVHDGSDPDGRTAPGYCLFEAYVRVGKWQHFPLTIEPLKTYAGPRPARTRSSSSTCSPSTGRPAARAPGCSTAASTAASSSARSSRGRWPSWCVNAATGPCKRRTAAPSRSRPSSPNSGVPVRDVGPRAA